MKCKVFEEARQFGEQRWLQANAWRFSLVTDQVPSCVFHRSQSHLLGFLAMILMECSCPLSLLFATRWKAKGRSEAVPAAANRHLRGADRFLCAPNDTWRTQDVPSCRVCQHTHAHTLPVLPLPLHPGLSVPHWCCTPCSWGPSWRWLWSDSWADGARWSAPPPPGLRALARWTAPQEWHH